MAILNVAVSDEMAGAHGRCVCRENLEEPEDSTGAPSGEDAPGDGTPDITA